MFQCGRDPDVFELANSTAAGAYSQHDRKPQDRRWCAWPVTSTRNWISRCSTRAEMQANGCVPGLAGHLRSGLTTLRSTRVGWCSRNAPNSQFRDDAAPLGGAAVLELPGKMTRGIISGSRDTRTRATDPFGGVVSGGASTRIPCIKGGSKPPATKGHQPHGLRYLRGPNRRRGLKILLCRSQVLTAPWGIQMDAYRQSLRGLGALMENRNPCKKSHCGSPRHITGPVKESA